MSANIHAIQDINAIKSMLNFAEKCLNVLSIIQ